MFGALRTLGEMHLHAHKLDTREGIVDIRQMLVAEFPTVHFQCFEGSRYQYPAGGHWFPNPLSCHLLHVGRNNFRERVACPVQSRLHRTEVAVGNLCNLFVRLALELPENEHVSVMLRQLCH